MFGWPIDPERSAGYGFDHARPTAFFGGWHVGVNFACGLERRTKDGRHFMYAYNCSSANDELNDLDSNDGVELPKALTDKWRQKGLGRQAPTMM
jgi:hypothetical protein